MKRTINASKCQAEVRDINKRPDDPDRYRQCRFPAHHIIDTWRGPEPLCRFHKMIPETVMLIKRSKGMSGKPAMADQLKLDLGYVEVEHDPEQSDEWFTPEWLIELARTVLGTIDLDPASCATAQTVVKASQYYTIQDDGLALPWQGRAFLNPPYSKPLAWVSKALEEYQSRRLTEAIILTGNDTSIKWAQLLLQHAQGLCFPSGRLSHWNPVKEKDSPRYGSMITYFGSRSDIFKRHFGPIGFCVQLDLW